MRKFADDEDETSTDPLPSQEGQEGRGPSYDGGDDNVDNFM